MFTNPTNPNHSSILIEQFQRKGYQVRQIKERDTTLIILSHDKKTATNNNESLSRGRN